ncbi:hypothetical protein BU14_0640s0007 [Porphyra umbilicalis]|uniref:Dynein light chain n=1 Tax=Porphyra umbilicalis TaxID=2786 RepID=A0A1X6NQK6_PORUM|nr:hypothetical protein BU14_0640s0007 [Porphyra umbilicalis]|eukprot:OSX70901.1 hypothetical protein BU14_0640s0007 [Porphyra umbilicalis]
MDSSDDVWIKDADMRPDMQQTAISIARAAIYKRQLDEKAVAGLLQEEFDSRYGGPWHCIVGRHYATKVIHQPGGYLYFYINGEGVLLFKALQDSSR